MLPLLFLFASTIFFSLPVSLHCIQQSYIHVCTYVTVANFYGFVLCLFSFYFLLAPFWTILGFHLYFYGERITDGRSFPPWTTVPTTTPLNFSPAPNLSALTQAQTSRRAKILFWFVLYCTVFDCIVLVVNVLVLFPSLFFELWKLHGQCGCFHGLGSLQHQSLFLV